MKSPLIFPPVGTARILEQTRHLTTVDAFSNMTCSFLQFLHLIRMNFDTVFTFMSFTYSERKTYNL